SAIWRLGKGRDGAFNLVWLTEVDWAYLNANRRRRGLNGDELADSWNNCRIAKNCRVRYVWRNLLEQFQPLSTQVVLKHHKAGSVAARPRQTFNNSGADGVWHNDKDNWNGASSFQHHLCTGAATGDEHVRGKCDQSVCIFVQFRFIAATP